ncbi:MAG: hypothetical protein MUF04_10450 [Akkermansiaceae bacterium]|nr:hypothetical protein [Akkermansiaceae bacterium]
MNHPEIRTVNSAGTLRVIVTKPLPGSHWLDVLTAAGCRVEIAQGTGMLSKEAIIALIGDRCDGAIGQLTEPWDAEVFGALRNAGGRAYSNYAVGFNNVDVAAATAAGIPVGNTPGVLTETTAEIAVALTFSASRRIVEGDRFMRAGQFTGWLVYYDLRPNQELESYLADYGAFLAARGEPAVTCRRLASVDEVLREADVVSLHTLLDASTRHLINAERLAMMKPDAILINTSRGPVVDEAALVDHCRSHPEFRAGLDVFEDEPAMKPGLVELDNVVIVPHIASATKWTREGMASLAACNVAAILQGHPVNRGGDVLPFLSGQVPPLAPSIVNADALGLA